MRKQNNPSFTAPAVTQAETTRGGGEIDRILWGDGKDNLFSSTTNKKKFPGKLCVLFSTVDVGYCNCAASGYNIQDCTVHVRPRNIKPFVYKHSKYILKHRKAGQRNVESGDISHRDWEVQGKRCTHWAYRKMPVHILEVFSLQHAHIIAITRFRNSGGLLQQGPRFIYIGCSNSC